MGQAPAIGANSLRTFPRNFPGRSGTTDDQVWLCSPETAVAAAVTGQITDPRSLGTEAPRVRLPDRSRAAIAMIEPPLPLEEAVAVDLVKAPSIGRLPDFDPLPERIEAAVVIKVGDDISTDEIMPAGAEVLPYRSDIAKLAEFVFHRLDPGYVERARAAGDHIIVGGRNYGQGSSREHAAIAPRSLGLRVVIALSFARIHWQNLANFGILALEFVDPADYDRVQPGDTLAVEPRLGTSAEVTVRNTTRDEAYATRHRLSDRQVAMVLAGGSIPLYRSRSH
jgi:aconitate hydratase